MRVVLREKKKKNQPHNKNVHLFSSDLILSHISDGSKDQESL